LASKIAESFSAINLARTVVQTYFVTHGKQVCFNHRLKNNKFSSFLASEIVTPAERREAPPCALLHHCGFNSQEGGMETSLPWSGFSRVLIEPAENFHGAK
jgi:hypothetical protein